MSDNINAVELAAELTAAWLSSPNTRTSAEDAPTFLIAMHEALLALMNSLDVAPVAVSQVTHEPAVSARKSLSSPDYIISMLDGKKYKTLRRHLSTHGYTPEQYRERFNLKADYPMVAVTYSEARRVMAKSIGLGRKAGTRLERIGDAAAKTVRKNGKAVVEASKSQNVPA